MKKVEKKDVTPGLECVLNDADDAVIYNVTHVEGRIVKLSYLSEATGEMLNGGESEVSLLMYPSEEQLKRSALLLNGLKEEKVRQKP